MPLSSHYHHQYPTQGANSYVHCTDRIALSFEDISISRKGVNCVKTCANDELITAGRDGILRQYQPQQDRMVLKYAEEAHTGWITDMVVTTDQRIIVTASHDSSIKFWRRSLNEQDNVNHRCIGALEHHTDYIKKLAYSPSTGILVSAGLDKRILLWDIHQLSVAASIELPPHLQSIRNSMSTMSPLRRTTSPSSAGIQIQHSSSHDSSIFRPQPSFDHDSVWTNGSGSGLNEIAENLRIEKQKHSIYALDLSSTGTLLASGSTDKIVRLWDPRVARVRVGKLRGHIDTIRCLKLNAEGTQCLSGSSDGRIILWDIRTQRSVEEFDHHSDSVWCLDADDNFHRMLSGGRDRQVFETNLQTRTTQLICRTTQGVLSVAATQTNSHVWVATSNASVEKHSLNRSQTESAAPEDNLPEAIIEGHSPWVRYAVLNKTTELLLEDDRVPPTITRWDILKGECIEEYAPGSTSLEAKRKELFEMVHVSPWYQVDLSLGRFLIVLDPKICFDGVLLASYINPQLGPDRRNTLVNVGEYVLRMAFRKLCEELPDAIDYGGFSPRNDRQQSTVPELTVVDMFNELNFGRFGDNVRVTIRNRAGDTETLVGSRICAEFIGEEAYGVLPVWIVDCLHRRSTMPVNEKRICFHLVKAINGNRHEHEELNIDNKFSAAGSVQIESLLDYVCHREFHTSHVNNDLTEAIELFCHGESIPLTSNLSAIQNHIWKSKHRPMIIVYRLKVPSQN